MFLDVLRFVRLPLVMILIFAAARFYLGVAGVPYAPRGNAMFSVVGVTIVSGVYFGALSKKVGNFSWFGTFLVGLTLGLFGQILIFSATFLSYSLNLPTYYVHWDSLNIKEGETLSLAAAMTRRSVGLLTGSTIGGVMSLVGRAVFGFLVAKPKA